MVVVGKALGERRFPGNRRPLALTPRGDHTRDQATQLKT